MQKHGIAWQSRAKHGKAWQSMAKHGKAWQKAEQNLTKLWEIQFEDGQTDTRTSAGVELRLRS